MKPLQLVTDSALKPTFRTSPWLILGQSLKYSPVFVALPPSFLLSRTNSNLPCCVRVVQADKIGSINPHVKRSSSFTPSSITALVLGQHLGSKVPKLGGFCLSIDKSFFKGFCPVCVDGAISRAQSPSSTCSATCSCLAFLACQLQA